MTEKEDLWWNAFCAGVITVFLGAWPPAEWMSGMASTETSADMSEGDGLHDDYLESIT